MSAFSISPNSLIGGGTTGGTITLDGPAYTGGVTVTLACDTNNLAVFPSSVTIPANATSANFSITLTSTVDYVMTATFSATLNTDTLTAPLTLWPDYLHVTALTLPTTLRLEWPGSAVGNFVLTRQEDSNTPVTIATLANTLHLYNDTFAFQSGHIYTYTIHDSNGSYTSTERVAPYFVTTTDNQSVDSRLDLRYGANVFLDHLFQTNTYRGGLFVGYASDPSRVGRSFARFTLPSLADTSFFRLGSFSAYSTGAVKSGTGTVSLVIGCQATPEETWDGQALKWSNVPTVTPAVPYSSLTLTYDPANPTALWYAWPFSLPILNTLRNTTKQNVSVGLTSVDETANGWAYFAKKEYDSTLAPTLSYLFCKPVLLGVTATPTSIKGGNTGVVTLLINGLGWGPGIVGQTTVDTIPVYVGSSNSAVAQITGNAYYNGALLVSGLYHTLTVTTYPVTQNTSVTLSFSLFYQGNGVPGMGWLQSDASVTITVTP